MLKNIATAIVTGMLGVFLSTVAPAAHAEYTQCTATSNKSPGVFWHMEHGRNSPAECFAVAKLCTDDDKASIQYHHSPVLLTSNYRRCSIFLVPGRAASHPDAKQVPSATPGLPIRVVRGSEASRAPETQTVTTRSGRKSSGERANWSAWYEHCSDPLPTGYKITSSSFALEGHRACGSWSKCVQTVKSDRMVCFSFAMQGEESIFSKDNGARESEGVLTITAQN